MLPKKDVEAQLPRRVPSRCRRFTALEAQVTTYELICLDQGASLQPEYSFMHGMHGGMM